MLWEAVFMFVVLKIPVLYLCAVVWYAVRAEPDLAAGDSFGETAPRPWRPWHSAGRVERRPRRGGPHGAPMRPRARAATPARAVVRR